MITPKQYTYIISILKSKGKTINYDINKLSKRDASAMIRSLLGEENRLKKDINKFQKSIKVLKAKKLLPDWIDPKYITTEHTIKIVHNMDIALDRIIPMIEIEMGGIENRLIDNPNDHDLMHRMSQLDSRYKWMISIRERKIYDIDISGIGKKLSGYINNLFNTPITLIDDLDDKICSSTVSHIYI